MRGWKIAAAVIGVIVAFFVVSAVAHLIIGLIIDVVIAAIVAGGIYVAIKMARSNKQVSGKSRDSEIRDHHSSSALPRSDLDEYIPQTPAPRPASRPAAADVDDELARLKREMGSLSRTVCPDGPTAAGSCLPGGTRRPGFRRT